MSEKAIISSIIFVLIFSTGLCSAAQALLGASPYLASPRIIAMGGALVAVVDDANAVFLNPADLGDLTYGDLSTSYGSLPENLKQYYFVGSAGFKDFGGLGLGYYMVGFFDEPMDVLDGSGNVIGLVNSTCWNGDLAVGYGKRIGEGILLGGRVRRLSQEVKFTVVTSESGLLEDLNNSGEGYGLDVGLLIKPFYGFSVGILFENLYTTDFIYNDGMHESIPSGMRLGFSYLPTNPNILLAMDFRSDNIEESSDIDAISIGSEIDVSGWLKLRFGYLFENDSASYAGTGSAGLGINFLDNFRFDYAYRKWGGMAFDEHYFSLGAKL